MGLNVFPWVHICDTFHESRLTTPASLLRRGLPLLSLLLIGHVGRSIFGEVLPRTCANCTALRCKLGYAIAVYLMGNIVFHFVMAVAVSSYVMPAQAQVQAHARTARDAASDLPDAFGGAGSTHAASSHGQPVNAPAAEYCGRCQAHRPPRSHHCGPCGRCILQKVRALSVLVGASAAEGPSTAARPLRPLAMHSTIADKNRV
jgi:hypothetical protein